MNAGEQQFCRNRGFTLLEILMVVGLAGLLVVIAYPGWKRSGLKQEAAKIRDDLEQIEKAVQATAQESKAAPGAMIPFDQYRKHLRKGSALEKSGTDPYGDAYGPQRSDGRPTVPKKAATRLKDVVGDNFWAPYPMAEE